MINPKPEDIEAMARALCSAERIDPDCIVYGGEPIRVFGAFYRPGGAGVAAWWIFHNMAKAALMKMEELRG